VGGGKLMSNFIIPAQYMDKINDELLTAEEELALGKSIELDEKSLIEVYINNPSICEEIIKLINLENINLSGWIKSSNSENLSPEDLHEKVYEVLSIQLNSWVGNSSKKEAPNLEEILSLNLSAKAFKKINTHLYSTYSKTLALKQKIFEVNTSLGVIDEADFHYLAHQLSLKNKITPKDKELKLLINQQNSNLKKLYNTPFYRPRRFTSFRIAIEELKRLDKSILKHKHVLVQRNLRLVLSLAFKYKNRGVALDDLLQEGNIGLLKVVDKFDYRLGYKFSTYAHWWIDQAIRRTISNNATLIRIPVYMRENINKISKQTRLFQAQYDREPTVGELGELTKLSKKEIEKAQDINVETVSIFEAMDEAEGESGSWTLADTLSDPTQKEIYDEVLKLTLIEKLKEALGQLSVKEEKIIRLRFGIGETGPQTLELVKDQFNVSREKVRQIQNSILTNLRETLDPNPRLY